jgi:hypothetical protein
MTFRLIPIRLAKISAMEISSQSMILMLPCAHELNLGIDPIPLALVQLRLANLSTSARIGNCEELHQSRMRMPRLQIFAWSRQTIDSKSTKPII